MKKETMVYETNSEFTKMKNELLKNGYSMVANCYWCQNFIDKKNSKVTLERLV